MTLILIFFLVPVVMTLGMSLYDWPLFGPRTFVGLQNYQAAFSDSAFGHALLFTAQFTAIVTPILFVVGMALASLMRTNRRGVGIFRTVYFIPVVVGFASASYLWVWALNSRVGVLDAVLVDLGLIQQPIEWLARPGWALFWIVVLTVWKTVGFTMLLLMVGMQAIPEDYYEAAKVDGATVASRFFHITLPLLRRHIALVLILSIIAAFLSFDQFYIITGGGPQNKTITAVYWIFKKGFTEFQLGYAAALSVVLMAVLVAISAVQLRLLREET
jgi:multiple sugar transport system permease protein